MQWGIEKDGEQRVILHFSGSLTLQNADELRKALQEALAAAAMVTIVLDDGLEIDIAGLQMLCSAHRTALASGRKLVLNRTIPEPFRSAVKAAGFLRPRGCTLFPDKECLWTGGNLS